MTSHFIHHESTKLMGHPSTGYVLENESSERPDWQRTDSEPEFRQPDEFQEKVNGTLQDASRILSPWLRTNRLRGTERKEEEKEESCSEAQRRAAEDCLHAR